MRSQNRHRAGVILGQFGKHLGQFCVTFSDFCGLEGLLCLTLGLWRVPGSQSVAFRRFPPKNPGQKTPKGAPKRGREGLLDEFWAKLCRKVRFGDFSTPLLRNLYF